MKNLLKNVLQMSDNNQSCSPPDVSTMEMADSCTYWLEGVGMVSNEGSCQKHSSIWEGDMYSVYTNNNDNKGSFEEGQINEYQAWYKSYSPRHKVN